MTTSAEPPAPFLRTVGISKTFGETRALDSIGFEVAAGELRALVGGNGSGKSTFVKILAGVHRPDGGGQIVVGDASYETMTPELARSLGFRFVHQDAGVVDDMTVAENLVLGHPYPRNRLGLVDWSALKARAGELIERFDIDAKASVLLRQLRPATRAKVAIARALQDINLDEPGLLVFDEPTTALPNREAAHLLEWLRGFAERGQAVLFVSHRLDEVLALAETVTAFRDGRHQATVRRQGLDEAQLIQLIAGRAVPRTSQNGAPQQHRAGRLELRGVKTGPLRGIDLTVGRGEIVGIAGLLGSGRTSLLRAIIGDLPVDAGKIVIDGESMSVRRVADGMAAGIAYVPENRLLDAGFPDLSVRENLVVASIPAFRRFGLSSGRSEIREAGVLIGQYGIRCGGQSRAFSTLSGGNQQKAVVARWLRRKPRVLLLDEPSQGVDVLARNEIEQLIRQHAADGMSVIVVTSDFDELARLCDRVVVLREGVMGRELRQPHLTEDAIAELTYGPMEVRHVDA